MPPIELCNNGQNICSECKRRHHHCPICGANITIIRIVILDSIARRQKYPCAKRDNGCPDLLSIELIAEHQAVCKHGPIICPLSKTFFTCSWKGVISLLEQHAKATHSAQIIKGATFLSSLLQSEVALVFCFDKVFLYYKKVRYGRCYCAVQLIGPSSQASKFRCEFKLRAANEMEQMRNIFFVRSYSEDFETSFYSGKCLRLDDITVGNFVVKDRST